MMSLAFSAEPVKISRLLACVSISAVLVKIKLAPWIVAITAAILTIALFRTPKPAAARLAEFPKPRILFDALGKLLFKPVDCLLQLLHALLKRLNLGETFDVYSYINRSSSHKKNRR